MILLTAKEIIEIHKKLAEKTGGSEGLREQGLLESAVYSAAMTFGSQEAYPTVEEKAARLMFSLTGNHAFIDGNKRIGVVIMLMTLQLNGIRLSYTQEELAALGLSAADGSMGYDDILDWIRTHRC